MSNLFNLIITILSVIFAIVSIDNHTRLNFVTKLSQMSSSFSKKRMDDIWDKLGNTMEADEASRLLKKEIRKEHKRYSMLKKLAGILPTKDRSIVSMFVYRLLSVVFGLLLVCNVTYSSVVESSVKLDGRDDIVNSSVVESSVKLDGRDDIVNSNVVEVLRNSSIRLDGRDDIVESSIVENSTVVDNNIALDMVKVTYKTYSGMDKTGYVIASNFVEGFNGYSGVAEECNVYDSNMNVIGKVYSHGWLWDCKYESISMTIDTNKYQADYDKCVVVDGSVAVDSSVTVNDMVEDIVEEEEEFSFNFGLIGLTIFIVLSIWILAVLFLIALVVNTVRTRKEFTENNLC